MLNENIACSLPSLSHRRLWIQFLLTIWNNCCLLCLWFYFHTIKYNIPDQKCPAYPPLKRLFPTLHHKPEVVSALELSLSAVGRRLPLLVDVAALEAALQLGRAVPARAPAIIVVGDNSSDLKAIECGIEDIYFCILCTRRVRPIRIRSSIQS